MSCSLCGADDPQDLTCVRIDQYLSALGIVPPISIKVACRLCGHVYANPQLDKDELARLYGDVYRSESFGHTTAGPDEEYLYWKRRKADDDYAWLTHYRERSARVGFALEIGCGEGLLLSRLASVGWQTLGVEPTPSHAAYARDVLGIHVLQTLFEEASLEDRHYDLVLAMFVLEHVKQPLSFLRRVRGLLTPDGSIFLTVPSVFNLSDFPDDWLSSPHLTLFTPRTLEQLLGRAGLQAIHIGWAGEGLAAIARPGRIVESFAPPPPNWHRLLQLAVFRARARATLKVGLARARHRARQGIAAVIGQSRADRLVTLLRR